MRASCLWLNRACRRRGTALALTKEGACPLESSSESPLCQASTWDCSRSQARLPPATRPARTRTQSPNERTSCSTSMPSWSCRDLPNTRASSPNRLRLSVYRWSPSNSRLSSCRSSARMSAAIHRRVSTLLAIAATSELLSRSHINQQSCAFCERCWWRSVGELSLMNDTAAAAAAAAALLLRNGKSPVSKNSTVPGRLPRLPSKTNLSWWIITLSKLIVCCQLVVFRWRNRSDGRREIIF